MNLYAGYFITFGWKTSKEIPLLQNICQLCAILKNYISFRSVLIDTGHFANAVI